MGFIAGLMLLYMAEEDAFRLLVCVAHSLRAYTSSSPLHVLSPPPPSPSTPHQGMGCMAGLMLLYMAEEDAVWLLLCDTHSRPSFSPTLSSSLFQPQTGHGLHGGAHAALHGGGGRRLAAAGMGFIAGLMLLYMAEEDAFWLLVALMKGANHTSLEGIFLYIFLCDRGHYELTFESTQKSTPLSSSSYPTPFPTSLFIPSSLFSHSLPLFPGGSAASAAVPIPVRPPATQVPAVVLTLLQHIHSIIPFFPPLFSLPLVGLPLVHQYLFQFDRLRHKSLPLSALCCVTQLFPFPLVPLSPCPLLSRPTSLPQCRCLSSLTLLFSFSYSSLLPLFSLPQVGLPLVQQYLFQFDRLLHECLPQLARHMEGEGVTPSMYASQWFITVFAYSFPFATTLRIWDVFLFEGMKTVFRVGLALLKQQQDDLLQMPFEDLVPALRTYPDRILEPDTLLNVAFSFNVSERLRELEAEYNAMQHPPPIAGPKAHGEGEEGERHEGAGGEGHQRKGEREMRGVEGGGGSLVRWREHSTPLVEF
ncbi:unnamed protein product [Closterium sp. Yama58-4]|nr:unnamed protein product [Closterium sp. Yama58-4]